MRRVLRRRTSEARGGGGPGRGVGRDGRDWPATIEWGWPETTDWVEVRVETNFAANSGPASPEPIGPHQMRLHRCHGVRQWETMDQQDKCENGRVG